MHCSTWGLDQEVLEILPEQAIAMLTWKSSCVCFIRRHRRGVSDHPSAVLPYYFLIYRPLPATAGGFLFDKGHQEDYYLSGKWNIRGWERAKA
jgi:hypothetical protein